MTAPHRVTDAPPGADTAAYDVVGVGFGPSNLALAIALQEVACDTEWRVRSRFVERKPGFCWHPGMLLPDARAQVPFLKDLVTLRNPRSRFSYLSWLQDRGLLFEFANLRQLTPSRSELNQYFQWAAREFEGDVDYGHEIVDVEPVTGGGTQVDALDVVVRGVDSGHLGRYRTRNLVVATGGRPCIPAEARGALGDRVFHSNEFLHRLAGPLRDAAPSARFVVVGAGQSAGDVVHHLLSSYPEAEVCVVIRGFALRPLDESPFVNELFAPRMTDAVFDMEPAARAQLLSTHRNANYAAISGDLLETLYERIVRESLLGRRRVELLRFHELCGVESGPGAVRVRLRDTLTGATQSRTADAMVLATGYERSLRHSFLERLIPHLHTTPAGDCMVTRDYRLGSREGFRPQIFAQGFSEGCHGMSDTLLSLVAIRAGELAGSILASGRSSASRSAPSTAERLLLGCHHG